MGEAVAVVANASEATKRPRRRASVMFRLVSLGFKAARPFAGAASRDDCACRWGLPWVSAVFVPEEPFPVRETAPPGTTCVLEPAADPGAADGCVTDHGAGVRRVDHAAAADVDADVVAVARPAEEHEVSGLKGAERDRRAGALLVGGAVREADADLRVAVHHEAGAVEAARAGAAVHVGDAEVTLGDGDDGRLAGAAGIGHGGAATAAARAGAGGAGSSSSLRRGLR